MSALLDTATTCSVPAKRVIAAMMGLRWLNEISVAKGASRKRRVQIGTYGVAALTILELLNWS